MPVKAETLCSVLQTQYSFLTKWTSCQVSSCRPADRQCDDSERGKIVLCDKIAQFTLLSRAGAANMDNGMLSYLSGPPAERVAIRGVEDEGDLAF